MEMLIVVAIIAVLIAIAIPVFTSQLERSREATDMANVRAAYGTVAAQMLEDGSAHSTSFSAEQKQEGWQTTPAPHLEIMTGSETSAYQYSAKTDTYTVSIDASGSVTVE